MLQCRLIFVRWIIPAIWGFWEEKLLANGFWVGVCLFVCFVVGFYLFVGWWFLFCFGCAFVRLFLTKVFLFVRVLTLWFDYGHWPDVNEALVEGVKAIQIDTWLQVNNPKGNPSSGSSLGFAAWYPLWSLAKQSSVGECSEQCAVQSVTNLTSILNKKMRNVSVFICRLVHINEKEWKFLNERWHALIQWWSSIKHHCHAVMQFTICFRIAL